MNATHTKQNPHWFFNLGESGLILMWDPNKGRGAIVWLNEWDDHLQVPHLIDKPEEFLQVIIDCCDIVPTKIDAFIKKAFVRQRSDTIAEFESLILEPANRNLLVLPR